MTVRTVVATANVLGSLRADRARAALGVVLATAPDLVGLQEWYVVRHRILRESGSVRWVPGGRAGRGPAGYRWLAPLLGGCAVGARADRFEPAGCRTVFLSGPGRGDRGERPFGAEPPRQATIATYRDLRGGRPVSLVDFHLSPGVQVAGRYRDDRPLLVGRHRTETRRLQHVVDRLLARGHDVYAVGDSNFDGYRLTGLVSAWEGRSSEPGTLGPHRKVDDVHASAGPAASVTLLASDSDHKAVVAEHLRP